MSFSPHAPPPSSPKFMKYKFKYLGMKWRFLKFDLEKESLPPIPKGDPVALEQQTNLEKSIIFETYEREFHINADSLSSWIDDRSNITCPRGNIDDGSIQQFQVPEEPRNGDEENGIQPQHDDDGDVCNDNLPRTGNEINSASILEDSMISLQPYPQSEIDSVFTQEDLLQGIRNAQLFQTLQPLKPLPPSTGLHHQVNSTKPMIFSPRPPEDCKPSASVAIPPQRKVPQRSPRRIKINQKNKRSNKLKEQIQKLEISKSFKMYDFSSLHLTPSLSLSFLIDSLLPQVCN